MTTYAQQIAAAVQEAAAKAISDSKLDQREMFYWIIRALDLDAIIASVQVTVDDERQKAEQEARKEFPSDFDWNDPANLGATAVQRAYFRSGWQAAKRDAFQTATAKMVNEREQFDAWFKQNGFEKYAESMFAAWQERASLETLTQAREHTEQSTTAWLIYDASSCEMLCTVYSAEEAKHYMNKGYKLLELVAKRDAHTEPKAKEHAELPAKELTDAEIYDFALRNGYVDCFRDYQDEETLRFEIIKFARDLLSASKGK